MLLEPFLGLGQELSPALVAWDPYQGKLSAAIRATYVLETQEVKRVRFITGLRKVHSNESSETHHPRLFFGQFQSELPESIREVLLEPRSIASVLEVSHKVVSKPGQIRLSPARRLELLLEPKIKSEVQVDISQDRTDRSALGRSFLRSRDHSLQHISRIQPFADEAQDERVCDPMSDHLLQHFVLDVVKVAADVRLE
jgi:hypothetical protein